MVKGHVPEIVSKGLLATGRVPAIRQMQLAIGLPLRNQDILAKTLLDLYNPASPGYRKYLTPQQFAANFGPTAKDYETVRHFAESHGLTVTGTFSNRLLLDVSGAAADVERAFHVNLRVYPHPTEARTFFAPDVEPTLESGVPVLHIAGLSDYALPHPASLHQRPASPPSGAVPNAGSDGGDYVGLDFRAAYAPGVTLNGAGQSVALVEFDTYYPGDVNKYFTLSSAGLLGSAVKVVPIGIDESTNTAPGPGNGEVSLDIDMAISMAPGLANVYVYEGPNNSVAPDDLFTRLASDNLAQQVSSSWSGFSDSIVRQAFQEFAAQGQTFFIAAGDSGAYVNSQNPVEPPVDDPLVTSVGGTTLNTTSPRGPWSSETVWNWFSTGEGTNAGSGGISPTYAIPTWQQGIDMSANQGSTTSRNFPDVALTADKIFIYDNNGVGQGIGGTSAAAPLWAGFMALVNQQNAAVGNPPVGYFNPTLYALAEGTNYAACFHDITTGDNTNLVSPNAFFAGSGYDLCTGWGTPNGSNLINVLAVPLDVLEIIPYNGFSASATAGGPIKPTTQSLTLTNVGTSPLNWDVNNPTAWLMVAPSSGTIPVGGSTTVAVSLNTAVAPTLPQGSFSATIWFTNLSDGVAQSRRFSLTLVGAQVVQNGGFETGDFTNWTFIGNGQANFVGSDTSLAFTNGSGRHPTITYYGPYYIRSGNYAAFMGEAGDVATLSQSLTTVSNADYLLSFWIVNPGIFGGSSPFPNEFSVSWNGKSLYDQIDLTDFSYTNMQYVVLATNTTTLLSFGFRCDPDYFGFDDVTATILPQPAFQSAIEAGGSVELIWSAVSNVTYQLQYTTTLVAPAWVNLGSAITATSDMITTSDLQPADPQRYYRVVIVSQ
jgi:hypothetical protein